MSSPPLYVGCTAFTEREIGLRVLPITYTAPVASTAMLSPPSTPLPAQVGGVAQDGIDDQRPRSIVGARRENPIWCRTAAHVAALDGVPAPAVTDLKDDRLLEAQ
jgi:hypothetical protein